ncbi:MAG: dihydrodipicolinate synthase family protein, partial [Acidobacteria bacterium]|nr:dihydrodipicolinate synthase family protein [Acidobacteriota bacterium]
VGCVSTRETVRLAQKAEAEEVDFLLVATPYYIRPSAEELREHYAEVCRAVALPVLAVSDSEHAGSELTPLVVRHLAHRCENFAGLVDSSGNLDAVPELVALSGERPFVVLAGRDDLILPALELGCSGAVSAGASVAPRLYVELYRDFEKGEVHRAARLQAIAESLHMALGLHTFPSAIKEAARLAGLPAGCCRRPVGPVPAEIRRQLSSVLDRLRQEELLSAPQASMHGAG